MMIQSVNTNTSFPVPFPAVSGTAAAVSNAAVAGLLFQDIIGDAEVGDTLHCVFGQGCGFFTTGHDYPVVDAYGEVTVRDDENVAVPTDVTFLISRFELVRNSDAGSALLEPVPMTNMVAITEDEHSDLQNWAFKGAVSERLSLLDDIASLREEIAALNNTDGSEVLFKDMDDEMKGALLVAQFRDKRLQAKSFFGRWTDIDMSGNIFADGAAYRVRPPQLSFLESEIKDAEDSLKDVEAKMDTFRTEGNIAWF